MIFISTFHSYTGAHWHFQGEGCGGREEPLQGDSFLLELFQHQEPYKVIRTYSIQKVILRFWYQVNLINHFQKKKNRTRGSQKGRWRGGAPPSPTDGPFLKTEIFRQKRRFLPKKTPFLGQFLMDFFLTERGVPPPPRKVSVPGFLNPSLRDTRTLRLDPRYTWVQ